MRSTFTKKVCSTQIDMFSDFFVKNDPEVPGSARGPESGGIPDLFRAISDIFFANIQTIA